MIRRRVWTVAIAAIAAGTMLLGSADRAQAGIRLKVESGATTKWFYTTSDTMLVAATTIGAYSLVVETTLTNFPGTSALGSMSQTVNLGLVGASPSSLEVMSWVVDDSTLGGLTPGEITLAADIALLTAAAEKEFTAPPSLAGSYMVSSDAGSALNVSTTSGTLLTTTYVDGTALDSLVHTLVPSNNAFVTGLVPDGGTANAYTLSQRLILSGINAGSTGQTLVGSSSVTAIPEPGTFAMAFVAIGLLGARALRQRRRTA